MESAVMIFVVGIGGVFVGMGLLYAAIRTTAAVVARWLAAPPAGKAEG